MADVDTGGLGPGNGQTLTPEQLEEVRRSLDKPGFLLEHRTFETLQTRGLNTFLGHDDVDGDTERETT